MPEQRWVTVREYSNDWGRYESVPQNMIRAILNLPDAQLTTDSEGVDRVRTSMHHRQMGWFLRTAADNDFDMAILHTITAERIRRGLEDSDDELRAAQETAMARVGHPNVEILYSNREWLRVITEQLLASRVKPKQTAG